MKANILVRIIRGTYSKIANDLEKVEFSYEPKITVAQRAPCCIQCDGSYPKQEGWVEFTGKTVAFIEANKPSEVWIKTATYGCRGRKWYRKS